MFSSFFFGTKYECYTNLRMPVTEEKKKGTADKAECSTVYLFNRIHRKNLKRRDLQ